MSITQNPKRAWTTQAAFCDGPPTLLGIQPDDELQQTMLADK
ncbi:hypothetical protein [Thiorhodococcus minor]|nr:hypothetical protein [Thiorhodococcus minor]